MFHHLMPFQCIRSTIFTDPELGEQFGGGGNTSLAALDEPGHANNYSRPGGQNVCLITWQ
jgi:hypothetical protein